MDQDALEKCQNIIGYRFQDESLLRVAMTHASAAPTRRMSNERMEFLGDAILGQVICAWLYDSHPDMLEGDMTMIKSTVVSRESCAAAISETGLISFLDFAKGMGRSADLPQSVSAGVLEAIIGAVYLDGGLEPAREFILSHMAGPIADALESRHQRNYKSLLQQVVQRRWGETPLYEFLDEKGPDHNKCFEIAVTINGKHYPSSWGTTKKEAEQRAAMEALVALGLLDDEELGEQ